MKYKVGDKVRVRGDLETGKDYGGVPFLKRMECLKNKIAEITKSEDYYYGLSIDNICYAWTSEMLRPAEFKILCETEEEKQAVLEELKKEGYLWAGGLKPTEYMKSNCESLRSLIYQYKVSLYINENIIIWDDDKEIFINEEKPEITPSEFTGIDFSEKIIITKTPTGATATYGDKTVTTEGDGDFEDASRQALAEVLCPFKVGDMVKNKYQGIGEVTNIQISSDYNCIISVYYEDSDYNGKHYERELEPYTEPPYNAKLFCIKGSNLSANDYFKKGHIYEVKNGEIVGYKGGGKYTDIEHINDVLVAKFMEVLDE